MGWNYSDIEIRAWVSNYFPLFYMVVITYQCLNPDVSLADLYK